jgi:hypothetical protein
VERVELDIVLAEKALILAQSIKELTLSEPAFAVAGNLAGWDALDLCSETVFARKCTVTLDLALLTEDTRQHALGLGLRRGICRWRVELSIGHLLREARINTDGKHDPNKKRDALE